MVWTLISKPSVISYTNVAKPLATSSVITSVITGGEPIGLLLALTTSSIATTSVITNLWTDVSGNSTVWTSVPNATP